MAGYTTANFIESLLTANANSSVLFSRIGNIPFGPLND